MSIFLVIFWSVLMTSFLSLRKVFNLEIELTGKSMDRNLHYIELTQYLSHDPKSKWRFYQRYYWFTYHCIKLIRIEPKIKNEGWLYTSSSVHKQSLRMNRKVEWLLFLILGSLLHSSKLRLLKVWDPSSWWLFLYLLSNGSKLKEYLLHKIWQDLFLQ